ncbi:MAG TPA: hypothetical protein VJ184_02430 [Chryseolinea sp.]|nr:hypothetical protein [Chryseolinea sp.]
MILLTLADFDGFYGLAKSIDNNPLLQEYIDRFEESYIKRILGVELGQLFIDDIKGEDSDSASIESRFQIILDPFQKQDGSIYESKGMKKILAGLIYSEFVEDNQIFHSQSGATTNRAEVSDVLNPVTAAEFAATKWNSSVISIMAVQWWCETEDTTNYAEYDGTYFRPKYPDLL